MPWKNVIIRFVSLAQTGRFAVTELCEQFGISRTTAYKHLERYVVAGLKVRPGSSFAFPVTAPKDPSAARTARRQAGYCG